ncbi:translation initiation factor IF-2-like [Molothrus ater]|uniref:translation initiation factor IF-2-like n=1 Tax=Molothrus ater TaxID=84834 RepID=UPI00174E0CA2|nr:translation initiation factor IF-2-like [Molothrus ater]
MVKAPLVCDAAQRGREEEEVRRERAARTRRTVSYRDIMRATKLLRLQLVKSDLLRAGAARGQSCWEPRAMEGVGPVFVEAPSSISGPRQKPSEGILALLAAHPVPHSGEAWRAQRWPCWAGPGAPCPAVPVPVAQQCPNSAPSRAASPRSSPSTPGQAGAPRQPLPGAGGRQHRGSPRGSADPAGGSGAVPGALLGPTPLEAPGQPWGPGRPRWRLRGSPGGSAGPAAGSGAVPGALLGPTPLEAPGAAPRARPAPLEAPGAALGLGSAALEALGQSRGLCWARPRWRLGGSPGGSAGPAGGSGGSPEGSAGPAGGSGAALPALPARSAPLPSLQPPQPSLQGAEPGPRTRRSPALAAPLPGPWPGPSCPLSCGSTAGPVPHQTLLLPLLRSHPAAHSARSFLRVCSFLSKTLQIACAPP